MEVSKNGIIIFFELPDLEALTSESWQSVGSSENFQSLPVGIPRKVLEPGELPGDRTTFSLSAIEITLNINEVMFKICSGISFQTTRLIV